MAGLFDVAGSTIDNWIAKRPEFLGAIKDGRVQAFGGAGHGANDGGNGRLVTRTVTPDGIRV